MSYYPHYDRKKMYGEYEKYECDNEKETKNQEKKVKCGCCEKDCCGNKISKYRYCPKGEPIRDSICDCCVRPVEYVLKQLIGKGEVKIWTSSIIEFTGIICEVCDSLVTFNENVEGIIVIPICQIIEIKNDCLQSIDLLKPCCRKRTGECRCCECPLRKKFEEYQQGNLKVIYRFIGDPAPIPTAAAVVKVGEGVVILFDGTVYYAVPICKITSVSVAV
ncbi:hypothetical protein [Clostridium sp. DL1XJH146]